MPATIWVINPIITKEFEEGTCREVASYKTAEVDIKVKTIEKGPASIECRYDESWAVPGVLEAIKNLEKNASAFVVNCFGDPGVESAREITRVPVVGAGSSSMLLASLLSHRFSVVTVLKRLEPLIEEVAWRYGVISKLASVRAAEIPVLELEKDQNRLIQCIIQESVAAIQNDGAHAIVLGCTGMAGLATAVRNNLLKYGYDVPVIDPLYASVQQARVLATMGISHSAITYPLPPEKLRVL